MLEVTADPAGIAADWIAERLHRRRFGEMHLAVSGGSTPPAMFAALVQHRLDWSRLHIWQVDERCVPLDDERRNARQLGPFHEVGAVVHLLPDEWPTRLDVVHLGLGDDGHTASWPPGDPVVQSLRPVEEVGPFNGTKRWTLTPPVINAASHRMFLATGASKAPVIRRLLGADTSLPAAHAAKPYTIIADGPAASTR